MKINLIITADSPSALEQVVAFAQQHIPTLQIERWSVTTTVDMPPENDPYDLMRQLSGVPGVTIRIEEETP
jgi:hypothetical protein